MSLSLTFVITSPLLIWGSVKVSFIPYCRFFELKSNILFSLQKKHFYLIPWLFTSLVCIIINGLYLFSMVLKLMVNQQKSEDLEAPLNAFQFIILFVAFGKLVNFIILLYIYKNIFFFPFFSFSNCAL